MASLGLFSSETKRDLLMLMKQQGTISLDDAEVATGLTRTTLREHLGQLERDGLIERSTRRQGRGRPSLLYALTRDGHGLFPSRDHILLGRFLEFLQHNGEEDLIREFFEHFWAERKRDVEYQLAKLDPHDEQGRVAVVKEILQEQGFMPQIRHNEDGLVIRECNCPFPEAVKRSRLPCRLEAEFFESIFDESIGRVTYIPDGSPACTYAFPPKQAA